MQSLILETCLKQTSKNPLYVLDRLMELPFCRVHGPEHHLLVGAALLTAYHNAGGSIDLEKAVKDLCSRAGIVPAGTCRFWGACGAGISSGMFMAAIANAAYPISESAKIAHKMTSMALADISLYDGPVCCKRSSYLSILKAIDLVKEQFGIEMEKSDIVCPFSSQYNNCLGPKCPFHKS